MTLKGVDNHGILLAPAKVLDRLEPFYKSQLEKVFEAKEGFQCGIGNAEVQCIPAKHDDTVGFKLVTHEASIAYTSDTKFCKDALPYYKKADILILNCVYPFNTRNPDQLSAEEVVRILKHSEPKLAIITHFGHQITNAVELSREIQQQTGIQTVSATDGLVVQPEAYDAKLGQAPLAFFTRAGKGNLQGSQR